MVLKPLHEDQWLGCDMNFVNIFTCPDDRLTFPPPESVPVYYTEPYVHMPENELVYWTSS